MKSKIIVLIMSLFILSATSMANSLSDLYLFGATYIVKQSQGHFPDSLIDSFSHKARVLTQKEVEKLLPDVSYNDDLVYINYNIEDCVIRNVVLAIDLQKGVTDSWHLE